VVLYADSTGGSMHAARRLAVVKGSNDPATRQTGTLRDVAGSPNRALTMVHAPDDSADVIRELEIFFTWNQRRALIAEASRRLRSGEQCRLDPTLEAVEAAYTGLAADSAWQLRGEDPGDPVTHGWAAIRAAADRWPLLSEHPARAWWAGQEMAR